MFLGASFLVRNTSQILMVDIPSDDHQVRSNQDVMGLRFGGEADEEVLVEVRGVSNQRVIEG